MRSTRTASRLQHLLLSSALLLGSADLAAEVGLSCPCTLYSSGAPDSTASPTSLRVGAGIRNPDSVPSGPLRLTVAAHSSPSLFASDTYAVVSTIDVTASLAAQSSLPGDTYLGGYSPALVEGDPPLHFTVILEEFANGAWRWRERQRMQGRTRQGTARAAGGSRDFASEEWTGLIATGPADLALNEGSYRFRLPGLTNVSTSTMVTGNLELQVRQGNGANSFYTIAGAALSDLFLAPGDTSGELLATGTANAVNAPGYDDFYLVIRDPASGTTYLELDIPDDGEAPARRFIDLRSIDFVADSDGDGVSDYQEIQQLTDPSDASDVPDRPVVRVLVYYSQSVADDFAGDAPAGILHFIETTNQIYESSGIDLELEVAALRPVTLDEQQSLSIVLSDMNSADSVFTAIDDDRASTQADLAFAFKVNGNADSFCGIANLSGAKTNGDLASASDTLARTVSGTARSDCSVTTFAHEVGHMMGLSHSRPQNISENFYGTFPWATGHGEEDKFYTIMSYANPWPGARQVSLFANPTVICRDEDLERPSNHSPNFARPCGVDRSDPQNGADAALALNTVGYQVAAFTRDTDGDGTIDLLDDDDDGDGTPDTEDEAPLDPIGIVDTDLDGISDPRDPDDDNDGVPDDSDAFPTDRHEQFDSDSDGIGNNADPDDDNDGWTDAEETAEGTNPVDANDAPSLEGGLPLLIIKAALDRQGEQP